MLGLLHLQESLSSRMLWEEVGWKNEKTKRFELIRNKKYSNGGLGRKILKRAPKIEGHEEQFCKIVYIES